MTALRRRGAVAATAAVLLALSGPMSAAQADPGAEGFWYFDAFNLQDAHDAGITGEGVTIAVLDTSLNLDVPTLRGADIDVRDSACYEDDGSPIPATTTDINGVHGTNIVSYLVGTGAGYPGQTGVKGVAPDAKILFYSIGRSGTANSASTEIICNPKDDSAQSEAVADAIFDAIDAGADIISVSARLAGSVTRELALATALHNGVVVVGGLSNDVFSSDTSGAFPGGLNGVVSVQSLGSDTLIQGDHIDSTVDVAAAGVGVIWQGDGTWETQINATGTSIATPMVSGFLALVAQKYPDATGNQLIQTLIHNTGAEDHELEYDSELKYGFGIVSATHMLREDPSQYEDVNPLIDTDPNAIPSTEQIANASGSAGDPDDPSTGEPADDPVGDGIPVLPIVLGALALLVVVGLVIFIIVRASRRPRTPNA